jgi:hypothetical protein
MMLKHSVLLSGIIFFARLPRGISLAGPSSNRGFGSFNNNNNNNNNNGGGEDAAATFTLFDRFRPSCPATFDSIRQFDPSLIKETDSEVDVWVAVYRSSNNKPSVLVKDEFLKAMKSATSSVNINPQDPMVMHSFSDPTVTPPVAVARLRPSDEEGQNVLVLDSMRCVLKKENTDRSCDGGSEHTEALATAIDSLIMYYLTSMMPQKDGSFEGMIRTKATLVSAKLLEDRGFKEVTVLQKDFSTHTSSLDDCMKKYAERSVSTTSKSPGARRRAIEIVSHLGRIDRAADLEQAVQRSNSSGEDYDPWAGMKQFL